MRCRDDAVSVNWIDDDASLAAAAAAWTSPLALDTEFVRTNTFYPMPGLYQVASGGEYFLIDPLQITDWSPFVRVLQDAAVVKVMHACLEDLELLHHHLNAVPVNVFDTQLAHAFVSSDYSLSYAALVNQRLSVHIEKHETRSDWLQRPLTKAQADYAVEDIQHLIALYEQLQGALHQTRRLPWFAEDMLVRGAYDVPDPSSYYAGVKKAWRLDPTALARLRSLCQWREETARSENVPRNRVVWDEHLLRFAQMHSLDTEALIETLPRVVVRRYADALRIAHAQSDRTDGLISLPGPLTTAQGKLLKELRQIAANAAASLEVAPELIARKRDVEACIRHVALTGELSTLYQGWRGDVLGPVFKQRLVARQ